MTTSKPLEVMSLRLSSEERERLEQLARDRHLTLSGVLREGLKLYGQDVRGRTRQEVANGSRIT